MPSERDERDTVPASPAQETPTYALSAEEHAAIDARARAEDQSADDLIPPAFHDEDVIADRYRIIRFIARGGMGEVYEAEDLTLHGRLALKTIRPEIAADPNAVDRFKREINVARRITHPNVSRIYDVGIHRAATETMFLTMEFLAGDTLQSRIISGGRMSEQEALPLVEQIASGLAAAHDAGIIHRDFKSANVMLVPSASNGLRAVVTDFGLARPATSEAGMLTLSEAGMVMGTPAYMAPEQVEGQRLTAAADIYAFGIVLYEMVTGKRPFTGDTPLSVAVRRLTNAPRPPREIVPSLDPAWDTAIIRCLERNPADRYQRATEVVHALRSGEVATAAASSRTAETVPIRTTKRSRLLGAALGLAVIGLFGVIIGSLSSRDAASTPPVSARMAVRIRPSLAVFGFRNTSARADAAWLSTAISEMLTTELAAGGKLRIISGDQVARAKADLGLSDSNTLDGPALQRLRKTLDATSMAVGSYTLIGEPGSGLLRIDLRVVDSSTGNVIASSESSGTESQLFDLVSRAAGGLRQRLGLGSVSASEAVEVQATVPSTPEAVRLYTQGLAHLRRLDAAGARDLLVQAAREDEKHPFIRSALSSAHTALGEETKAREEATRALALAGKLGREQKALIEFQFHKAAGDWPKAAEVARSLWESFPDNLEYGLDLANAEISAGSTKAALATIAALRKLPAPLSNDGRIDLEESRAHQELGDFQRQREFAAAASRKGRANSSRLLVARARMLEATALLALGEMPAMTAAVDEARSLFQAAGDRGNMARAIELTATAVHQEGDLAGERRLLEEALSIHRSVGDSLSEARVLLNIGHVLLSQGETPQAQKYFDDALGRFKKAGAKYAAASSLNNIGANMFYRGDLLRAQKRYQEALSIFSELGEKSGIATTLTNIGEVMACRGDLEQARKMHEDALAINRATGEKGGIAYDLFRLGEIFYVRGELVAARDRFQQSLALQNEIGDTMGAAESRVTLAAIAIEQGQAATAETTAREAEEIQRTGGAAEPSFKSLAVVAEALLAQGKINEARETAERAWKAAADSEDRRVRFGVAITRARAMAASRAATDVNAALRFLDSIREEASRSHFAIPEMEARLAAGQIEVAAGRAEGRRRLTAVQKDAASRGFGHIARRAAAGTA